MRRAIFVVAIFLGACLLARAADEKAPEPKAAPSAPSAPAAEPSPEPPVAPEPPVTPEPPPTATPKPEPDPKETEPEPEVKKWVPLVGADGEIKPPAGMVRIPAGPFQMGATDQSGDKETRDVLFTGAERPVRWVNLKAFFIDVTEVRNTEYKMFVDETRWREPFHWEQGRYRPGTGRHPVVKVNYRDVLEFARWRSKRDGIQYRLPFETEWEKAARGTDGRLWPWGNIFDPAKCVTAERFKGPAPADVIRTMPVGSNASGSSPYGVMDMAGNVWEWTQDWYDKYPNSTTIDKDFGKKFRVVRGGSWLYTKDRALCARRKKEREETEAIDLGFRLVADIPSIPAPAPRK